MAKTKITNGGSSSSKNGKSSGSTSTVAMPSVKCPYGSEELAKWRAILVKRREEITGDIRGLLQDAMEADSGNSSPTHQADRGSDVDLQDMSLAMVSNEEELLWQIDRALRKIDTSQPIVYGVCEQTFVAIPKPRLKLLPWTPFSIEGASALEEQGLTMQDAIIEG